MKAQHSMADSGDYQTKPPIGIVPKHVHDEWRMQEIFKAITRYDAAGEDIPICWIMEYNDLACLYDLDTIQSEEISRLECSLRTPLTEIRFNAN